MMSKGSRRGVNRRNALADLDDIASALAEQLRVRQAARFSERSILALGGDLLIAFAQEERENISGKSDWRPAAIRAVLLDRNQPFTLLPPTIEEITRWCQTLATDLYSLPCVSTNYLAIRNSLTPDIPPHQPIDDIRNSTRRANEIGRLYEFFKAPNFTNFEVIETYLTSFSAPEVNLRYNELYNKLCSIACESGGRFSYPVNPRPASILRAARELAICELARDAGAPLYFATGSKRTQYWFRTFHSKSGDEPSSHAEFVLPPLSLITLLGLRETSPQALRSLHTLSVEAQNALQADAVSEYWPPFDLPEELQDVILRAKRLREVAAPASSFMSQWEAAWDSPIDLSATLPIEEQVASVRSIAKHATHAIDELMHRLSQVLLPDLRHSHDVSLPNSVFLDPATTELLRGALQPSRLATFKLIIHTEVLNMSQYHISQTGDNNTAIVDSYNAMADAVSLNDAQLQTYLKEFVSAILQSGLPAQERNDAIDISTAALSSAREDGTIKGKAKIAWNGLKEVLTEAPKALQLWEKISGLLT